MDKIQSSILTAEQEKQLRKPISDFVGAIQSKIDALRLEGTDEVLYFQNQIDTLQRNRSLDKARKAELIAAHKVELGRALEIEKKNEPEVTRLIIEAEDYIKKNFRKNYYIPVKNSCKAEKMLLQQRYQEQVEMLKREYAAQVEDVKKKNMDATEKKKALKEEKYIYKNRLFDAKNQYELGLQAVKDRLFAAVNFEFHMLDLLRMSRFTTLQAQRLKWETYRYTFNKRSFFLKNGLYIAIVLIFILLSILAPTIKGTQLLTVNNILNIFQQASPRMFLALGVAGLIMLTGTDLSIGRMVGMGITVSTIVMHKGVNTGAVFGVIFDFTGIPIFLRVILALVLCIVLCTIFTSIAGFFTAKFKMHPFISTMANMLVIFGIVTYATKGVSFGAIEPIIPQWIIPKINGFPTIILWAVAAIIIVWFIWNKTIFGKNLYAVGGNPEAASVSGISVFKVTMLAFVLAGILYGFGSWLESARMVGSGSAAYGQGWEMDAIAACVVGGVSFTGGIGKISGVVSGVIIFTALTYALTVLGLDTNLQFVFSGIIILIAVTLDSLKYVRKK